MIHDIVLPTTTPDDWPAIRADILQRVLASMGEPSTDTEESVVKHEILEEFELHGLKRYRLRFYVMDGEWTEAYLTLPADHDATKPTPAVVVMHGAHLAGAPTMCDRNTGLLYRAYATDLAERGFITLAPFQYAFGKEITTEEAQLKAISDFYERHPNWSLDGRRLLERRRAVDVLNHLPFARVGRVGIMGNSLGGRTTIYSYALDDRFQAAVASTGVSPNATNVFRNLGVTRPMSSPALSKAMLPSGQAPWEYQELLALGAPRALLIVDPYNDPWNPEFGAVFECFHKATRAFRLLNCPDQLSILIHGAGHDIPPDQRDYAYRWFEKHLANA